MMSFVLLGVLTAARSFLTSRLLAARGDSGLSPHALGYLIGSVVAIPLVAVGVASLWRANRSLSRLLMVANAAMFLSVVVSIVQLASVKPPVVAAPAVDKTPKTPGAPEEKIFQRDAWLADCVKHCRQSIPNRLPALSEPQREQHCALSCECGLEHITDPGPGKGQVHAPSARWKSETDDQHRKGVTECLERASAAVKASHPG
jgi:hypothetical protein